MVMCQFFLLLGKIVWPIKLFRDSNEWFFAVVINTQTLKFEPQPMVYVFHCCQSFKWTSQETEVHFSWVKRSYLSDVIGRFWSISFVSVFYGSLAVAIIVIDSSKKHNRQLGFEFQSLHVIERCNNLK